MKHTPKPWNRNIPPATKYPTIYAGRNTHVAVVQSLGLTPEEVEANANLITAAPELLEVAQLMVEDEAFADLCAGIGEQPQWLKLARAAIAKAEGRDA